MQKIVSYIIVVLLMASASSCSKFEPNIDENLIPYFDRFADEGSIRGVTFDYVSEEIEGSISNIDSIVGGVGILGLCQPQTVRKPFAGIIIDDTFWNAATDLQKEYVVFHELGHCFLDRDHQIPPLVDSLGFCVSIMAAGGASCDGLGNYTLERREVLLDELFSN